MTDSPRPRGRPKGTGINDREILAAIIRRLSADAGMRPTTAIRLAGITDPSVLRRLREKLKLVNVAETPETKSALPLSPLPMSPRAARHAGPRKSPLRETSRAAKPSSAAATPVAKTPRIQDNPTPPSQSSSQLPPADEASLITDTNTHAERPTAAAPTQAPPPDPQLEALRLSAEAAAAMSRLYLHCLTFAFQTNPMSLALRSQTMMSQWMAGFISSQMKTE